MCYDNFYFLYIFYLGAIRMKKNGGKCGVCGDRWDSKVQPHA